MTETITIKRALATGGFTTETASVTEPEWGTKFGAFHGKWGKCHLCSLEFPESSLTEEDGKFFCSEHGCFESYIGGKG